MNAFDDWYLTTLGTRVSKKSVDILLSKQDCRIDMDLLIWDIMGRDGLRQLLKDVSFFGVRGVPLSRT